MTLRELQEWVRTHFDARLADRSTDYGVARLLTQSGQLGEAVLRDGNVAKEIADVLFVVCAIANRKGIDVEAALQQHVGARTPDSFFTSLDS